jgi:uncharacterized membrane protein YhhN
MTPSGGPFLIVSVVAGIAYGAVLQFRPAGAFRTSVKTAAVGALALWAWMAGAPPILTGALALSAVGDAFLAGDPDRWLPPGLGSFLLAHVLYTVLFLEIGGLGTLQTDPARLVPVLAAGLVGTGMLAWLWRDLGSLRPAVAAYVLAIVTMVGAAFTLDRDRIAAMVGAVAFMASDGVLSWRLFKHNRASAPIADHAVWWLYWGGQTAIATAFLL